MNYQQDFSKPIRQFLQTIEQEADIAKNQIATAEEAREELLEGDL